MCNYNLRGKVNGVSDEKRMAHYYHELNSPDALNRVHSSLQFLLVLSRSLSPSFSHQ